MAEVQKKKSDISLRQIVTPVFRVSHPHVFKPSAMKGIADAKPSYSIQMLFDKATTSLDDMKRMLNIAAKERWGDKSNWPEQLKQPIRDGDKPRKNRQTGKMEVKKEHAGMWVVSASSPAKEGGRKPHVVDRDKQPIESASDFYAGCYARAFLTAGAYEITDDNAGVKFYLDGVQFIKDGEPLGGGKSADQMFGDLPEEDGDDLGSSRSYEDDSEGDSSFM